MHGRICSLKKFSKISQEVLVTQRLAVSSKTSIAFSRFLHVKTYDKDANLRIQRGVNELPSVDKRQLERSPDFSFKKGKSKMSVKPVDLLADKSSEDPDVIGNAPKEPSKDEEEKYNAIIKEHLNNHRLNEAIKIAEVRVFKDRVKPENDLYNLLISECANARNTRKAFDLYTKMRQRGLKVTQSTYSSLFNACGNALSRQNGLNRAICLRESLIDSDYEFSIENYNAMIKTFGHLGYFRTAYKLVDEMRDKKLQMTRETFNILLQVCASDEKEGFRHCLLTWHKMWGKNIKPDYNSFNAVLRCVRDCGFGDLNEMENVLQQILNKNSVKLLAEKDSSSNIENKLADSPEDLNIALNTSVQENTLQDLSSTESLQLPNLLAPVPHLGSMISLSEVKKPHERFLLLGGLTGFLELMKSTKITPDIRTFTAMLEVIPPTNTAEKQLLKYIRNIGLKGDIDFFNILIKKRAMRFDYEGGKEVLSMIRTLGLHPDIVSYGILALGCTTVESSRELIEEMRCNGIRMNIQILAAMLRQGCAKKAVAYICEIMQISLDENVKPNDVFLKLLYNYYWQSARAIDARHPFTKTKRFKREHEKFSNKYRLYQEEVGIEGLKLEDAIKKIKEGKHDQYKEDEGKPLKNEEFSSKNNIRKYIAKMKMQSNCTIDDIKEGDKEMLYFPNAKSDEMRAHMENQHTKNPLDLLKVKQFKFFN